MSADEGVVAASSWVLLGTDGAPYFFAERGGGPLVAAFFKADCPTCMMLFPYLERLYQLYRQHGLSVWGIAQDPLDASLAFAADHGVTFPILLDTTWDVSIAYGIETVPTTFLFDAQGTVTFGFTSFCKDDVNELARLAAEHAEGDAVVLAPPDDGKPPFRPG